MFLGNLLSAQVRYLATVLIAHSCLSLELLHVWSGSIYLLHRLLFALTNESG